MAGFWHHLPSARAIRLLGVHGEAVAAALDPLPSDAPAVVFYYPPPGFAQSEAQTPGQIVDSMLQELEAAAVELFPAWLPDAHALDGRNRLSLAAARWAAKAVASTSDHYGPFLANLAERAIQGTAATGPRFPREIRVAGLVRVLKNAYQRSNAVFLVRVPPGLSSENQRALASASEWVAEHGALGVWLTGPLESAERLSCVTVILPCLEDAPADPPVTHPVLVYPPIAGKPHHRSRAEQMLEEALLKRPWAAGRVWNQSYSPHALVNPVRLDLWWRHERCVVEIDGPDHIDKWKYAADRRRDVLLAADGLQVLRFTDGQVREDLSAVLAAIEKCLQTRRTQLQEQPDNV